MDTSPNVREKRRVNPAKAGLERTGLYHSVQLPNGELLAGAMSMEWQQKRLRSFGIPEDLTGKRVLDIGPWDGFYTFEMERRGADVTSIDYVDLDTFRALHRAYRSKATYLRMDIYELDPAKIGTFDIVLCLGVLYHLKHPLLALEKLCAICRDVCIVDTFVVDGGEWQAGAREALPYAEFYEGGELADQLDNWCGPSVSMVEAWIRSAGFARANVQMVTDFSTTVRAERKWCDVPADEAPAVAVVGLNSHANRGRTFYSQKESYIELWCAWSGDAPRLESIFPEVDGFGVAPLACAVTPSGLLVSLRLPPGLAPGRHEVRLKIGHAAWSDALEFYVDLPDSDRIPVILSIQDGVAWTVNEVDWKNGGWLTLWSEGLSPEADASNTVIYISDLPHTPHAVNAATGQINVQLRPLIDSGLHTVVLAHRGARSEAASVRVIGDPPPIRGLESLSVA